MNNEQVEKYVSVMKEIKLRVEVIIALSAGRENSVYVPPTLESIGLQFRKCFELIAFASLAANQQQYCAVYADFAKHWEAAKLIKNLKRINPFFYPKPVIEKPTDNPAASHALADRQGDYLTESDLIEAHGRCGVLLHSANPFGSPIDYEFFGTNFQVWLIKIMNLLNNHQIRMPGDEGFYLIHMKEEGHNEVKWYRFQPVTMPSSQLVM
jgi:hypothetical protein